MLSYTVGYQLSRRKSQGEMHMLYMYHEKTLAIADFQRPNSRKKVTKYTSIHVFSLAITRKYSLRGYILGVLTHTTAWDKLWGGDTF